MKIELANPQKRLKLLVVLLFGLLIIIVLGIFIGRWTLGNKSAGNSDGLKSIFVRPEAKIEEPLTGEQVEKSSAGRTPLAVVIENHPDARPQINLDQASVVYEAIAEGGITRFVALFAPNLPSKIGYVRSARTYFVRWAMEYNAPLVHVGGNIDALDLIKKVGARDIDQFRYGNRAFKREPHDGAATEHTMVAFPEKLREIAKEKGYEDGAKYGKFIFKQDASEPQRPTSQTVTVDFSTPVFQAVWTYRSKENDYTRIIGGKTYYAKNLIIQEVKRQAVTSSNGVNRFEFTLLGSGKAKVLRDGIVTEATWKKQNDDRARFYDAAGKEIEFNRGTTWYEVVHPELKVKIE